MDQAQELKKVGDMLCLSQTCSYSAYCPDKSSECKGCEYVHLLDWLAWCQLTQAQPVSANQGSTEEYWRVPHVFVCPLCTSIVSTLRKEKKSLRREAFQHEAWLMGGLG